MGIGYPAHASCVFCLRACRFGVPGPRPPMCNPDRPAPDNAALTPVARSPTSKISQLVFGLACTAETTSCGFLLPMSVPCCGCTDTVHAGHHSLTASRKSVPNCSRIVNTGSENSWITAFPPDCTTTYAASILANTRSGSDPALLVWNIAPVG